MMCFSILSLTCRWAQRQGPACPVPPLWGGLGSSRTTQSPQSGDMWNRRGSPHRHLMFARGSQLALPSIISADNVEEAYSNQCGTLLFAHHSLVPRPCPALLPYSKLGWGLLALFPGPAQLFVLLPYCKQTKLGRLGSEDIHFITYRYRST